MSTYQKLRKIATLLRKAEQLGKETKDEFKHLLKHSEEVAKKFWSDKADDVWDSI